MTQRNIGLDILRILLALMVIVIHFNAPATGHVAVSVNGPMKFLVWPVLYCCYPAVNTYVLISGYFGYSKKKSFQQILTSLLKLWSCLLFFSLLGYAIALVVTAEHFSITVLLKHFVPLTRGVWWYMTVYFVLMLISPALNIVLDRLSKKAFWMISVVSVIICSILPFFLKYESTLGLNQGSGLIWFVVLYLTGGGISKFYLKERNGKLALYAMLIYLVLTFYLLASPSIHYLVKLEGHTSAMYNSVIVFGQSVALFVCFWNVNIRTKRLSRAISFFAGLSLASYIFHCQEDIGRILWQQIEPSKYADSIQLIPVFLYTVLGVYILSVIIEFIRKELVSIGNFEDDILRSIQEIGVRQFCHIYDFMDKKKII